jgi:pyridoxine/pyridoxamine 5'-phosphate oxidase
VNRAQLIEFVRQRGLAVVATRDQSGAPEAALVGIAITDAAELVFDTSSRSRKCINLRAFPRVAVVVGWDDEVTVQGEGAADVLTGSDRDRCLDAYVEQYPDGRDRAEDPSIVLVRVRLDWVRHCDYRPDSFGIDEGALLD